MIILAALAIIINVAIAFNALLRPTYFNLIDLSKEESNNQIGIYDQERLAFIFLPIVGYITFFVMSNFGFSDDLGKHFVPGFILIQIASFALYFYSRKEKYQLSLAAIACIPSVLILGIITCVVLAIKLFYCYIICITMGWIFIILPFCVLSYYGLYQVVAFQSLELYKLFNLTNKEPAQSEELVIKQSLFGMYPNRNELFVIQIILAAIILCLTLFVFSQDFLGPFQISVQAILKQHVKF